MSYRWPLHSLGEICQTTSGGTPSRAHPEYFGGAIPWIKSGDLTDGNVVTYEETITEEGLQNSSAKLLRKGTVLIAMYGATVGRLGLLGIDAATNQAVCGITTPNELDRKFLFYFLLLQRKKLIEQSTGGAQPNISQKIVRELVVPVPPIAEQRRIVDILKRAGGIRRLRKQAIQTARELIPALFVDVFGDPATNPKGWPKQKLEEISTFIGGGTPSREIAEYWNGDIPWVSPKDMKMDRIYTADESITQAAIDNSATSLIPDGSILMVTRSGILRHSLPLALTRKQVCINQDIKAIVPGDTVNPHFLFTQIFLRRNDLLRKVRTGATVHNLWTDDVKQTKMIIPPADLQLNFAEQMEAVWSLADQQSIHTVGADNLFQSLLHRAFHGEL